MDVDGESEAIQQILKGIDLDQLEDIWPDEILFNNPLDGCIPNPLDQNGGAGGIQNPAFRGHLGPIISSTNPQGTVLFDNRGFDIDEESGLIRGGTPVPHLSHLPDSPPDSGSEPYSPPEMKLDQQQLAAYRQSLSQIPPDSQSMIIDHNSVTHSPQIPQPNRTLIQNGGHQRQHSLPTSIPLHGGGGGGITIPTPSMVAPLSSIQVPAGMPALQQQGVPHAHTHSSQLPHGVPVSSVSANVPQQNMGMYSMAQQGVAPQTMSLQGIPSQNIVLQNMAPQNMAPQDMVPQSVPQPTMGTPSMTQQFMNFITQNIKAPQSLSQVPVTETINTITRKDSFGGHVTKKRKHSLSPHSTINENMLNNLITQQVKQEPVDPISCPLSIDGDYTMNSNIDVEYGLYDQPGGDGMPYTDTVYQCLKWQPYQPNTWHTLLDCNGQEISAPNYKVEADKGFNFAVPDDSFVCQKKNHFQVTVHCCTSTKPKFVQTETGMKAFDDVFIHIHGIKMEASNSYIRVEQSQADRSKKPFKPTRIDMKQDSIVKATIGRLHFSETTSNNMRKKGKPNPDQRYFMVVVSIEAHCASEQFTIASHVSEKIIVRASNPGQFENDVDVIWQKGSTPDSIFHSGKVGINNDHPDEALVVNGHLRVTGKVMQPSDQRAKQDFQEVNSKEQLQNIGKLRIMRYKYIPAFREQAGLPECDQVETGVIAQEVMEILPDAVEKTGTVDLRNGHKIEHFLVVNKDRIYMENVGAVKELVRLTDNLETRIHELEEMNQKLSKLKRVDSLKSNTSVGTLSRNGSTKPKGGRGRGKDSHGGSKKGKGQGDLGGGCLSPRSMQMVIVALILIMLFCCAAIATLYILQHHEGSTATSTNVTGLYSTTGIPPFTTSMLSKLTTPTARAIDPGMVTMSSCMINGDCLYCCETEMTDMLPPLLVSNILLNTTYERYTRQPVLSPMSRSGPDQPLSTGTNYQSSQQMPEGLHNASDTDSVGMGMSMETITKEARRRRSAARRNSRETTLDVDISSIILDESEILCNQHCSTVECGDRCTTTGNGNFTYNISVGPHFPLQFTELYVNSSTPSLMVLCNWNAGDTTCTGSVQEPVPDTGSRLSQGANHIWQLPVGLFRNSTYIFRIMADEQTPRPAETYCTISGDLLGSQFLEYRFHFNRDLSLCPATSQGAINN